MLICLFLSHFSTLFPSSWHSLPLWLALCSDLTPASLWWISSSPNCVSHSYYNFDEPTILNFSKLVFIFASFLQLGLLGGIFVLVFFITMVIRCIFFHISPRELLVTIYFLVGLCELLGDVGIFFSAHMLHLFWVESFGNPLHWRTVHWRSCGLSLSLFPEHGLALFYHGLVQGLQLLISFQYCPRVLCSCCPLWLQKFQKPWLPCKTQRQPNYQACCPWLWSWKYWTWIP